MRTRVVIMLAIMASSMLSYGKYTVSYGKYMVSHGKYMVSHKSIYSPIKAFPAPAKLPSFNTQIGWIFVTTTHTQAGIMSVDSESTKRMFQTKKMAIENLEEHIETLKENGWVEVPNLENTYGTTIRTFYKDGLVCNNFVLPIVHARKVNNQN